MRGLEIKGTGEKRNQWELILFFFFFFGEDTIYREIYCV